MTSTTVTGSDIRGDTPSVFLFIGDGEGDRIRENRLIYDTLLKGGHPTVRFEIFPDRNHGDMVRQLTVPEDTVRMTMLAFIADVTRSQK